MNHGSRTLVTLVALLLVSATAQARLNMKPGLWETAAEPGQPPHRRCYTQKDIDYYEAFLQGKVHGRNQPCRFSNYKASGNTVSYTMTCRFRDRSTRSPVTATFDGDSTTGITKGADGKDVTVTSRRVGDCSGN